jgi:hypothetical protein
MGGLVLPIDPSQRAGWKRRNRDEEQTAELRNSGWDVWTPERQFQELASEAGMELGKLAGERRLAEKLAKKKARLKGSKEFR